MRNPRHWFMLVGFLAQGQTWGNNFVLLGLVLLWVFAIQFLREWTFTGFKKRTAAGEDEDASYKRYAAIESVLLLVGCGLSILINRALNQSPHFFLGDGLILLQLARLSRPLNKREKLTSLIVACFHFGVLCTLAPNIRFVILFAAAALLFPKALKEVLMAGHDSSPRASIADGYGKMQVTARLFAFHVGIYVVLLAGSALFFIGAPRFTGTPLQMSNGLVDHGSLLDSVLDPRSGGRGNSKEVLMQVEGEDVGYLRCFTLTEFDGVKWSAEARSRLRPIRLESDPTVLRGQKKRTVFVKNAHYLGRVLPVDGMVSRIEGNFFSRPYLSDNDSVESDSMWSTANNVYSYWVDEDSKAEPLSRWKRQHLLWHPQQSERLKQWVEEQTAGETNALGKAGRLEKVLRNTFEYEIGTPELNRISPVEEFVFERKKGHCERFAASMALFLRMQGIPSRVVIGYAASTRNIFSGRLQVRFSDAHSWTEGYFEGLGWVSFDATPGPAPGGVGSEFFDFLDALDFAWYSHVVNFNGFAQKELVGQGIQMASNIPREIWDGAVWGFIGLLVVLLAFRWRGGAGIASWFKRERNSRNQAAIANHYYGEMLAELERAGFRKPLPQTPLEFLAVLRNEKIAGYTQITLVTEAFCQSRYGGKAMTPEIRRQVEEALRILPDLLQVQRANGKHHATERS